MSNGVDSASQPASQPASQRILSLGAGVQSTTLYLMALEGQLQFDLAVFADTGDEPKPVYKHLEWLQSLNGPPILIRSLGISLGDQLLKGLNSTGQRFVSIPCFTSGASGKKGMVRRQCSKEFKTQVIERTIRREVLGLEPKQRAKKGAAITQIIGISFEERHRAGRVIERFKKISWSKPEFPLVDMGWGRIRCLEWLAKRVPHSVPKSACVYCPYHGNGEWRWLKENDPEGWDRAVQVDAALRIDGNVCNRNLDDKMYVHRSCVPLPMVDLTERDTLDLFSAKECEGVCGN